MKECSISIRLKCLFTNLKEKKMKKWADTVSTEKGPIKINEIWEEHEKEKVELEKRLMNEPKYYYNNYDRKPSYNDRKGSQKYQGKFLITIDQI